MIKRYNNLSFLFFVPGMVAQIAGLVMGPKDVDHESFTPLVLALLIGGTLLCFIGFGYYAKAKGRSMAWGALGFFSFPGLIALSLLKDRSGDPWNT